MEEKLIDLKSDVEKLIFSIGQEKGYEELHRDALSLLMKVVKVVQECAHIPNEGIQMQEKIDIESNEIAKVRRKLPRWIRNPDQINTRILMAFLSVMRSTGKSYVNEDDLKKEFGNNSTLKKNLPQMCTISSKNHAKIFSRDGSQLLIWEPVKDLVKDFEAEAFHRLNS